MSNLKSFLSNNSSILVNFFLVLVLAFYYFLFFNKGIIFYDEGLYVYTGDLIMNGKLPYIDFFLEYQPGYFYLLAGLYKIFGPSIIVGRLVSLCICLGIFICSLFLLKAFKVNSIKAKLIAFFCVASFGYPLVNIPLLTWPTVLITQLLMLTLISLFKKNDLKKIVYTGLLLALLFLVKQNVAVIQAVIVNILLVFGLNGRVAEKAKILFYINSIWLGITFSWVYIFFLHNNLFAFFEFVSFNMRLSSIYPFTYPPLSFLFQPLGILKLLPYYVPILFFLLLIIATFQKNKDKKLLVLFLPLTGFFTTIYPASDLLHVYPFFGMVLVALFLFVLNYGKKMQKILYLVLFLCVLSGFYLAIFKEYYRYHPPYSQQNTPMNLPKTQGLFVDSPTREESNAVYSFLKTHTSKNEYILAYPFSPMQYIIFERQNPSRYPIFFPGYLTREEELKTISDIQKKKTKYIITDGNYTFTTPLSRWIIKQKKIKQYGRFTIFQITKKNNY